MAKDRYTIISADTHAGGSHAAYREYLESKYHEDFDAWRAKYKNPYKDLGDTRRYRNWDNEMRNGQQLEDGVVGEVIFPNTIPPFFPSFVLFAAPPKPDEYEHRLAGIRAHNRWLKDFCADFPAQRAGIGQVFLNNVDDAIEDATWIKENGLRGGVLIPNVPPDATWHPGLWDKSYEPFWQVCEDLELPVQSHGGTGVPNFGNEPVSMLLYIMEGAFYGQRPFIHLVLSGVFDRHPRLRFVMTEMGASWIPALIKRMDNTIRQINETGETGEIKYSDEQKLNKLASECFHENCWVGVSQPRWADVQAFDEIGYDKLMWGSDYPHDEGTHPFTKEHLRALFSDWPEDRLRKFLAENAAELYDFDLAALDPLAEQYGPLVSEISKPLEQLPDEPNRALLNSLPNTEAA